VILVVAVTGIVAVLAVAGLATLGGGDGARDGTDGDRQVVTATAVVPAGERSLPSDAASLTALLVQTSPVGLSPEDIDPDATPGPEGAVVVRLRTADGFPVIALSEPAPTGPRSPEQQPGAALLANGGRVLVAPETGLERRFVLVTGDSMLTVTIGARDDEPDAPPARYDADVLRGWARNIDFTVGAV
jgi:hypothetical protein